MASFYVTHHKFPSNPQLFTITLNKIAHMGGEDNPNFITNYPSAERYWKVFIYTSGLDTSGDSVGPLAADVIGSSQDVNEFIENRIEDFCALIDWSQQGTFSPEEDTSAPIIFEQFPNPGQEDVPISTPVVIRVRDPLPGNGIDISSAYMKINGITITPHVVGNKFDCTFTFTPRPIYNS